MHIETGLLEHMVLQRTARGLSASRVTGAVASAGTLHATVTRRTRPVPGWRSRRVAVVRRGRFAFTLTGLPTGGPYHVHLQLRQGGRIVAELHVRDVLVGDVWIAAGQSNMQGDGAMRHALPPRPWARAFYMDDRWAPATGIIHNLWACVDEVHKHVTRGYTPIAPRNPPYGNGPAVAFVQEMLRRTGVPQGVLACAHGGTDMANWLPTMPRQGGGNLYSALLRRVRKNGGRVAGMIWYQGESDTIGDIAHTYQQTMQRWLTRLRRDLRAPRLPIAIAQIGREASHARDPQNWNRVQEAQRRLGDTLPAVVTVPTVDLELEDSIHIGGADINRLGRRFADALLGLTRGVPAAQPPPRLQRITLEHAQDPRRAHVRVQFANVIGRLRAGSRPTGFAILNRAGRDVIYRTELGPRAVRLFIPPTDPADGLVLHYGPGCNPDCNITDAADRSLPVCGPLLVVDPAPPWTAFVTALDVSGPQDLPSGVSPRLNGLSYPTLRSAMTRREFSGNFLNVHRDFVSAAQRDVAIYLHVRLRLDEPMRLRARLGYDGPLKLWINGVELHHNPQGRCPANPDQFLGKPIRLPTGNHDVVLALAGNRGLAWGVYLRFERLDLTPTQLRRGPAHYALPRPL